MKCKNNFPLYFFMLAWYFLVSMSTLSAQTLSQVGTQVKWGHATTATGWASTVWGDQALASGSVATAWGLQSQANGSISTAMGLATRADAMLSVVMGQHNVGGGSSNAWVGSDPLLEVGNGFEGAPSNALTVYKNGDVDISGVLTVAPGGDISMGEFGTLE